MSADESGAKSIATESNDEQKSKENKSVVSDATTTEIKSNGYNFKHDPCVFAPTGDIYSYFNRRPMLSASAGTFQYPFRYSSVQALS